MNAPMDKNTNPRLSQASIATATALQGARAVAAPAGQPPAQAALDVVAMLRRVVAHWPVIIVTMVLGAVITLQVVRTRKATFKSETVIFYKEGVGKSVLGTSDSPEAIRSLGTKLKETLLAQQNLHRLIDEFRLYPELVQKGAYAEAVDQMRKKTEFKARSQETFAITFEGLDKDQAQKVCARMAEVLVAENDKRLQEENRGATEILEVEKKKADEDLNRVEHQLSQFLQIHPEFASAKDGFGTEVLKIKADEDERRRGRAKPGHGARRGAAQVTPGSPPVDDRASAVDPVLLASRSQAQTDSQRGPEGARRQVVEFYRAAPRCARGDAARGRRQRGSEARAGRDRRRHPQGGRPAQAAAARRRPLRRTPEAGRFSGPQRQPRHRRGRQTQAQKQGSRRRSGREARHPGDGVGAPRTRPGEREGAPGRPRDQALPRPDGGEHRRERLRHPHRGPRPRLTSRAAPPTCPTGRW